MLFANVSIFSWISVCKDNSFLDAYIGNEVYFNLKVMFDKYKIPPELIQLPKTVERTRTNLNKQIMKKQKQIRNVNCII